MAEVKVSVLHLQCVDARPDVVVCLLAQTHQRPGVGLHALPQRDLQRANLRKY